MIRHQYQNLTASKLKDLIVAAIELLDVVMPFEDTRSKLSTIKESIRHTDKNDELRSTLNGLLDLVSYWDGYQSKGGYFKNVHQPILNEKLDGILTHSQQYPQAVRRLL